jgi:hypothetical protein
LSAVHGAAFLLIDAYLEVDQPAPEAACILNLMTGGRTERSSEQPNGTAARNRSPASR